MNKFLIAVFACLVAIFSCKGNKATYGDEEAPADSIDSLGMAVADSVEVLPAETMVPRAADELFDDFFFNFIVNKKMQKSRIKFPLPVVDGDKKEMIAKEEWKMDHFFMNQGYYTLIFDNHKQLNLLKDTSVSHVTVEKIYLDKKRVKQYVFGRENGLWQLNSIKLTDTYNVKNASFIDFYQKFANDTAFQIQHLCNPVAFTGPDPDDDFQQMEGVITPDTWLAFSPEIPVKMIYNIVYGQNYTESNRKIFLIRGIANGLEIEMVFKRIGGKWMLQSLTT
ncbi:MAG: DUF4348 domain-containing protein [Prevotella sp.]|nr:DUF4348 domain-containing protein [Prevotella sp.]MCI5855482.1 DUF4348 domain-containing protein [Prevotella sp.]MDD6737309.1 DUF4348 domain-containing protein [Prevotella sp.]MDY6093019.1 DUF4348 domain-containing protein [Prevotella sp.]